MLCERNPVSTQVGCTTNARKILNLGKIGTVIFGVKLGMLDFVAKYLFRKLWYWLGTFYMKRRRLVRKETTRIQVNAPKRVALYSIATSRQSRSLLSNIVSF